MYKGDRARKEMLVDHGFRLPSAMDNRPLQFEEFEKRLHPGDLCLCHSRPLRAGKTPELTEQIIRPTGLLDPKIHVRPIQGQIDDLIGEVNKRVERNERVLVTTLTKKMAEDLTDYLKEAGIKVQYLHSDIKTIERMQILRSLRPGEFDVLVGINLLREGLTCRRSPVAILDADKEGFLRAERSLIQTIGRAARNANGEVIMYADRVTESMQKAIEETERRRSVQIAHNEKHGITPQTIQKAVREVIEATKVAEENEAYQVAPDMEKMSGKERRQLIEGLEKEMKQAAVDLQFERAAELRDMILELKAEGA